MASRSTFFFFNDTAAPEIYTLSLPDALPISPAGPRGTPIRYRVRPAPAPRSSPLPPPPLAPRDRCRPRGCRLAPRGRHRDRKSTRLNSSHLVISYAVFCLKKKTRNSQHL